MRALKASLYSVITLTFPIVAVLGMVAGAAQANGPSKKDWTMLVFLNGHNNLDSYGTYNIKQMETVGSSNRLNVVVQWASNNNGDTRRIYVKKSSDTTQVTSPVIQNMGASVDMGDWRTLVDFVKWGVANYPAKHYLIDVWDHGSGWHDFVSEVHPLDISWDENSGHHITTEELGQAMAESAALIGHKVDLYASDACLMAMAEVAGEMSDSVQYFAGSQETEPDNGWPYDTFLKDWKVLPFPTAKRVAQLLVRNYVASYRHGSNGSSEVTYSAFDLSKMGELSDAVRTFGDKLKTLDASDKATVLSLVANTQTFADSDYADLGDFLKQFGSAHLSISAGQALAKLKKASGRFVIANADTDSYSKARGLSIWLPGDVSTYSQYSARYAGMKFAKSSGWDGVLSYLFGGN